ncbi:mechanosensitive ion channel family protein [Nannocystaceae bacterium ST9]
MTDLPFIPDALQPYMPLIVGSVTALVIFLLGWVIAGWVHGLVTRLLRIRKIDEAVVRFLASLAQWAVIAAAIITALARVGVETTSLVALLGTAGLAIGLALQGNLSHFASGVMLLLFRPISIGDVVEVAGKTGEVHEIGLFGTTLITPDATKIILANGSVTGGAIINYTALGKPRAAVRVIVAAGNDVGKVCEVLEAAARSVDMVLKDPAPAAVFSIVEPAQLTFDVMVHSKPGDFIPMQPAVRRAVYEHLAKANIALPTPAIIVHQAKAS